MSRIPLSCTRIYPTGGKDNSGVVYACVVFGKPRAHSRPGVITDRSLMLLLAIASAGGVTDKYCVEWDLLWGTYLAGQPHLVILPTSWSVAAVAAARLVHRRRPATAGDGHAGVTDATRWDSARGYARPGIESGRRRARWSSRPAMLADIPAGRPGDSCYWTGDSCIWISALDGQLPLSSHSGQPLKDGCTDIPHRKEPFPPWPRRTWCLTNQIPRPRRVSAPTGACWPASRQWQPRTARAPSPSQLPGHSLSPR
jgi:hypothetical protein